MRQLLCVASASILLVAGHSEAQGQLGSIEGTVRTPSGMVLSGATVAARSPSLVGVATAVTDALGVYRFPALPPGQYEVTATPPGRGPAGTRKIGLEPGQRVMVDLTIQVGGVAETAAERPGRLVGLDVFGGGVQFEIAPATETEEAKDKWGWETGATVSFGPRWLGITGTFGHHYVAEDVSAYHLLVGPRVTSPWLGGDAGIGRFFAHALGGFAHTSGMSASQTSAEWVLGGGMDVVLLRVQGDYFWLTLNGVKRHNGRFFIGGVLPLCFRACGPWDGFDLSGQKTK